MECKEILMAIWPLGLALLIVFSVAMIVIWSHGYSSRPSWRQRLDYAWPRPPEKRKCDCQSYLNGYGPPPRPERPKGLFKKKKKKKLKE